QVLALGKLHDERAIHHAVHVGDVRVTQRRQRLCFAREARETLGIAREQIGQHLDGDVPIELRVARAIHLAHPAGADGADDFVRAEARACSENHRLDVAFIRSSQPEMNVMAGGAGGVSRWSSRKCWPSAPTSWKIDPSGNGNNLRGPPTSIWLPLPTPAAQTCVPSV